MNCQNNGSCVITKGIPNCLCPESFEGKYCQSIKNQANENAMNNTGSIISDKYIVKSMLSLALVKEMSA